MRNYQLISFTPLVIVFCCVLGLANLGLENLGAGGTVILLRFLTAMLLLNTIVIKYCQVKEGNHKSIEEKLCNTGLKTLNQSYMIHATLPLALIVAVGGGSMVVTGIAATYTTLITIELIATSLNIPKTAKKLVKESKSAQDSLKA